MSPDLLQRELRAAIESVLDMELFRTEEQRERDDAAELVAMRNVLFNAMTGLLPD